ncbi:hypothetical protein Vsou_13620 [Vulcanisaeta souniana JCM 11219]|uniref:Uncharacterized protein n=1 Tax=Vulcanisaeta souniana JCM 11219 TaxID=1293586 RepID=A0A830EIK2_9CREN|nr:hypothetical protein Vsou_13620 [Vulcanisaeta souniana JCM 11219]GGI86371.1 hypothetical protein GCM10007112_24200 [Vulcanisaeta souniana JCM 11219]
MARRLLGSLLISLAIIHNGRVIERYGSEYAGYIDLLNIADDYNADVVLIMRDRAVILTAPRPSGRGFFPWGFPHTSGAPHRGGISAQSPPSAAGGR